VTDFFDDAFGKDGTEPMEDDGAGQVTWWPPKNSEGGDMLGGTLVKGYYRTGYEGKGVDAVLVIKDRKTDEVYSVGCGTRLLKDYVIELAPAEGALVALQYDGYVQALNSDRKFKKFIMRVDGKPDFDYWHTLYQAYQKKQQMGAVEGGFEASPSSESFGPSDAPF